MFTPLLLVTVLNPLLAVGEGWQAVYLLRAEDEPVLARLVEEQGWDGVLSSSLALVSFQDFSSFETIPVRKIAERLHPTDPRWDPFLKKASRLFQDPSGGEWIFVSRTRWDQGFEAWLEEQGFAFSVAHQMAEPAWGWQHILAIAAVLSLGGVLSAFGLRALRPWMGLAAFLATVATALSGPPFSASALTLLLFAYLHFGALRDWVERAWEEAQPPPKVFSRRALPLLPGILAVWGGGGGEFVRLVLFAGVFLALLGMAEVSWRVWRRNLAEMEHRLFLPLPLNPKRDRGLGLALPSPWRTIALVPFLGVGILAVVPSVRGGLTPPWSLSALPADWTYGEALQREQELPFPGPRTLLAHLQFQEGFPYGMRFPQDEVDRITLPEYVFQGDRLEERQKIILEFDEVWLRTALARTRARGVDRLIGVGHTGSWVVPNLGTSPSEIHEPRSWIVPVALILALILFRAKAPGTARAILREMRVRRQAA